MVMQAPHLIAFTWQLGGNDSRLPTEEADCHAVVAFASMALAPLAPFAKTKNRVVSLNI
jgi:hypothetical protein